jgi:hypothetical protein
LCGCTQCNASQPFLRLTFSLVDAVTLTIPGTGGVLDGKGTGREGIRKGTGRELEDQEGIGKKSGNRKSKEKERLSLIMRRRMEITLE